MEYIPHPTNTATTRFAQGTVRWRWGVIALSLLAVFAVANGGRLLGFNTDYRIFFSKENPQLLAFERLEKIYTTDDNVLFVLAPKDGNVFSRDTLTAVEQVTKAAWQVPYSTRVDSISNFQYSYADGNDVLVVRDLFENAAALSSEEREHIRDVALNEPLLANRLVSQQGHVTGINITVQLPGKDANAEVPELVNYVKAMAEKIRADYPQLELHMTGTMLLNGAFIEASQRDSATLVPLTFVVILVGITLLLRGWTGTFGTFWVILFSIATAIGAAGWLGLDLNAISAAAPTIIMTLAVANAVHILVGIFHTMRHGASKHEAIVESLRVNMQPVFLTSLTTAVGFLSMNFSDSPPFHDLGNIVAMGMGATFLLAVTFLPALMAVLPIRPPKPQADKNTLMDRFAEFVIRRRSPLLWGMAALVILLASFVPRNELGENFIEYFDHSIAFRVDSDFISGNLGGIFRIDYSLQAGESSGVSNPAFQDKVEAFANWYRQQPEVIHVSTFTDIMKRLNKNMHADKPAYYSLPDERNLAAQYLLLYEMSLPYGLDLNNQINVDKSATRMSVTLKNSHTTVVIALEERAQAWLMQNTPAIRGDGSSSTIMFSHITERNIKGMIIGTTLALILISFILVVALRSFRIGTLSLIPNLVPAAMGFGLWGLLVGEINMALAMVTGMTLGIVVDDTVHFLSKYLRARREKGLDTEQAVRYAFLTVGSALVVTSVVLVAGFAVLAMSSFKMNSDMGLLTAIIIILALAADFLFLPALLMKLDAKRKSVATSTELAPETIV